MDQIHYDWKSVGTYYDGYIVDVDSEFTEEYEQKGTELFSWIFHLARRSSELSVWGSSRLACGGCRLHLGLTSWHRLRLGSLYAEKC